MHEEWWEKPVCILCDFWWIFVLFPILVLTIYFAWDPHIRNVVGWPPTLTPTFTITPSPTSTNTPTATSTPTPTVTATPSITPTPELGTGDVQITLRWSGLNDLDLIVVDPSGEVIYHEHASSLSGGTLDIDSNRLCEENVTATPVENIFWPEEEAPIGPYQVYVRYFEQCTDTLITSFTVQVLVDGETSEYTGEATEVGEEIFIAEITR